MRWIVNNFYFSPYSTVLHFGEGRAFADTTALRDWNFPNCASVVAFDPNSPHAWKRDVSILDQQYDLGVSIYVFNTLEPITRKAAFEDLLRCCQRCLIAVRTDKVPGTKQLGMDGVITSRNTFQTQLSADAWVEWFERMSPDRTSVEVLHKTSAYVILDIKRK